ncbi:ubiquinone/menaquinone biosynthesis C-methylase UbiE [Bacillus pakistanensis]|uniref:Ubiquinone/menaquinone biosynthesis C-methylase UbiE n=1 Tax=Rossellomorea pakistanensis TaxID=992288 RepID=A0ABS2N7G0_9BACI|nr:class I SAM-dependent methyltransferase [Bacillus pakistanensis]MBM7583795.1 ubiquinone/menaquinone biosynthesis C-methylase UbiE [Bacillus pakistanensis]
MKQKEMLEVNKKGWNVVAPHFFGVEALPEYGPYTETEEDIRLMDTIKDKKVLEIGCGSGHSLKYMAENGAKELWGIDLSSEQIKMADVLLSDLNPNLICAPMEKDTIVPKNHFDIVYSIFAIGWTSDLPQTLNHIYSYLKDGGSLVFSWEHPFYTNLRSRENQVVVENSYLNEDPWVIESFKGENVPMIIPRRKISTFINTLITTGFTIEKIVEGEIAKKYKNQPFDYSDRYYSLYKANKVPTTLIIKARK